MTKKKASKKLTNAQVLEKYPNIKQYLETSKEKKKEWDEALKNMIKDEDGSFAFDNYFIEFEDQSSEYDGDSIEICQWIIKVTKDGASEFWQVLGWTSSYEGNELDDYWYDFKQVTPKTKEIVVWE